VVLASHFGMSSSAALEVAQPLEPSSQVDLDTAFGLDDDWRTFTMAD
jgi:hypothetical protein